MSDADAPPTPGTRVPHADTVLPDPVVRGRLRAPSAAGTERGLLIETSEGAQELFRRRRDRAGRAAPRGRRRPAPARGRGRQPVDDIDVEQSDDETMIINMGPQHPSTHGVLRLMIELDGETVLRTKPVIGYLHTGMEKTAEELTYVQGSTNVTRMDYLSPLHNELVLSLAVEALLGVEMPPRADWIRMLLVELNRVSSHLMWMATNGMDHGVHVDDDLRLPRARDDPGLLREDHRPADEPQLHPPRGHRRRPARRVGGRRHRHLRHGPAPHRRVRRAAHRPARLPPALRGHRQPLGRGGPGPQSLTGPLLRSTGVPWDLRRAMPYLRYDEVDFDVIVGTFGDNFDRYSIRLNEIRESIRIIRQIVEKMPAGDYRVQDKKVTPPPRGRIDESMEALIHHFKVFTEGFKVPEGEVYVAIESPRGELGCYLVSDGWPKPYRMHIRGPSFVNLQGMPLMMRGGLLADAVAVCSSIDPVMGEVDR